MRGGHREGPREAAQRTRSVCALAIAGAAAFTIMWSAPAAFASGAVVSTCDYPHLQAAIASADGGQVTFACSGTITVQQTIVVPSGQTVWLDGSGESVAISGGFANRVFDVEAGTLKLVALTVSDGRVSATRDGRFERG